MLDTRYIETAALAGALERYEIGAKEKLRHLTKYERGRLREALERLDGWIEEVNEEPSGSGTLTVKRV